MRQGFSLAAVLFVIAMIAIVTAIAYALGTGHGMAVLVIGAWLGIVAGFYMLAIIAGRIAANAPWHLEPFSALYVLASIVFLVIHYNPGLF